MSKFIYDITHLRKYVNGELSAREMHEIERASHDDEMLMDVLLGLETEKEIAQQKKAAASSTFTLRLNKWQIAASIVVLLSFAGILFWATSERGSEKELAVAGLQKNTENKNNSTETLTKGLSNLNSLQAPENKESNTNTTPHPVGSSLLSPHEQQILTYTAREKKSQYAQEIPSNLDAGNSLHEPNVIIINTGDKNNKSTLTASRQQAASSRVSSNPNMPLSSAQIRARLSNMGLDPTTDFMSVQVIDQDSKKPLAGVAVKDMQSDSTFLTDAEGRFSYASNSKRSYMIDASGYNPKAISTQDAELTISLAPKANKPLRTAALSAKKETKSTPINGWDNYLGYIREELAKVTNNNYALLVHMELDKKGTPVGIHIMKSSDLTLNAKVINLIARGPLWELGADWKNIYLEINSK